MILLVIWAGLMIFAFALIYHVLGPRFQAAGGSVGFGTLLYMSASTFLTLGLGDATSSDPIARLFIQLEAGSGYIFLALMITYMPVLEQAYGTREVGNLLIHSRAGRPPSAIKLLRLYAALVPRPEDVDRARAILAENVKGVGAVQGQMVDEAVAQGPPHRCRGRRASPQRRLIPILINEEMIMDNSPPAYKAVHPRRCREISGLYYEDFEPGDIFEH